MPPLKSTLILTTSILVLSFVIYQIEPPKSWVEASLFQWIVFYLPFFVAATSLANMFFKFYLKSLVLGLGLTLVLILSGLKSLNIISAVIVLLATVLIIKSLKKPDHFRSVIKPHRLTKLRKQ